MKNSHPNLLELRTILMRLNCTSHYRQFTQRADFQMPRTQFRKLWPIVISIGCDWSSKKSETVVWHTFHDDLTMKKPHGRNVRQSNYSLQLFRGPIVSWSVHTKVPYGCSRQFASIEISQFVRYWWKVPDTPQDAATLPSFILQEECTSQIILNVNAA